MTRPFLAKAIPAISGTRSGAVLSFVLSHPVTGVIGVNGAAVHGLDRRPEPCLLVPEFPLAVYLGPFARVWHMGAVS